MPYDVTQSGQDAISCYAGTLMLLVVYKEQDATSNDIGFYKKESGQERRLATLCSGEQLEKRHAAGRRPQRTARTGDVI